MQFIAHDSIVHLHTVTIKCCTMFTSVVRTNVTKFAEDFAHTKNPFEI